MRNNHEAAVFAFYICFMVVIHPGEAQVAQIDEIIRLDRHNAATLLKNDTSALRKYLSTDFIINGSNNRVSFGSASIFSAMRSGRVNYSRFDIVTDTVYFLNTNNAISMGSETVVLGNEDSPSKRVLNRRYTNIWVRKKKEWKLSARHSSLVCAE